MKKLILLFALNLLGCCIKAQTDTACLYGSWKLVHHAPITSQYNTSPPDPDYKGLHLLLINKKNLVIKNEKGIPESRPYSIKQSSTGSALQLKGKRQPTYTILYSDPDSLVLCHYIWKENHLNVYKNHYLRTDSRFSTFSVMKKKLLRNWHFCTGGTYSLDSLRLSINEPTIETCDLAHIHTWTLSFERIYNWYEMAINMCSGCLNKNKGVMDGLYIKELFGEIKFNANNTFSLYPGNGVETYRPVFLSDSEMMLVKVKQE